MNKCVKVLRLDDDDIGAVVFQCGASPLNCKVGLVRLYLLDENLILHKRCLSVKLSVGAKCEISCQVVNLVSSCQV